VAEVSNVPGATPVGIGFFSAHPTTSKLRVSAAGNRHNGFPFDFNMIRLQGTAKKVSVHICMRIQSSS
jgi:hypothetical protein